MQQAIEVETPERIFHIGERSFSDDGRQAQVLAAMQWNLNDVKRFMVVRQHVDKDYVDEMEREYRRFLGIVARYPDERFPVSEAVDEMWHVHILFTHDYHAMSKAVRGEYINHIPVLYEKERLALEPYYLRGTLIRYKEIYGEEAPLKMWPRQGGAICWSGYEIKVPKS